MRWNVLLGGMACALALQCAVGAGDTSYKLLKETSIGGEGGWDILTVDSGPPALPFALEQSRGRGSREERDRR